MNILIKGMDMPKKCTECPLLSERDYCILQDYDKQYSLDYDFDDMQNDCPLVEIPTPHGRLIDADELFNEIRANSYHLERRFQKNIGMFLDDIYLKIAEAHTIVEAEE